MIVRGPHVHCSGITTLAHRSNEYSSLTAAKRLTNSMRTSPVPSNDQRL